MTANKDLFPSTGNVIPLLRIQRRTGAGLCDRFIIITSIVQHLVLNLKLCRFD